ncbi:MAG: sigma-70 family RNA polymerase sigma factor [Deltaproteobacteria bacterium]|nr:sigma-70 family RNA polymerase sigma factor [Deltaproteobacteria bacterium]
MTDTLSEKTDAQLIEAFKAGSMAAMEAIVNRYEDRIFTFGLKMCGQLQDAEDIMQETFLNAFRYLDGFRQETKLRNWLFKIASSACIKKRRKKKCEPDHELSLDAFPGNGKNTTYQIPDWSNDPSSAVMRGEMKQIMDTAIQALPHKNKLVFNLRDIEGFSTKETADILGISVESVKTRLHRARRFLRKNRQGLQGAGTR